MSPLACRTCGDTDGPFTRDGRCEDCVDGDQGPPQWSPELTEQ
ncbi:hypothetical protein ACWD48_19815 [Streptomyces sp. NPDC002519]